MSVHFEEELARVLPADVPNRERLIQVAAAHLRRINAANEYMNLTRIISAAEAAIKHVYDSVAPWRLFLGMERVLDAGTGAGFPGIPLAVVHPDTRFVLAESIGKKARFVDGVVDDLGLQNVSVLPHRAEAVALAQRPSVITARAMAPLPKLAELFRASLKAEVPLLLYKGPDADAEIAKTKLAGSSAHVVVRYDLPDGMGTRTIVAVRRTGKPSITRS